MVLFWEVRLRVGVGVMFGEIHFEVGGLEEVFGSFAVLGEDGHADAGAGMDVGAEDVGGLRKFCGEAAHDFGGLTG